MLRFIIFLLPFIKEMIFGKKPLERRKVSFLTKVRQWVFFTLVVSSLGLNYLSITKLYEISVLHLAITKENKKLLEISNHYKDEVIKNHQLESSLNFCMTSKR